MQSLRNFLAAKTLGDKERIGWLIYLLAQMLFVSKSDLEQTHALAEQALSLLTEVGYNQVTAYALNLMGQIHLVQGKQELVRELIEESVALNKEVGDRAATAESLMSLARVLTSQGDQEFGTPSLRGEFPTSTRDPRQGVLPSLP